MAERRACVKSLYILSDSNGVGQYVTLHRTWAALLSAHLEGRYVVQNASRNGETTRQALERLVPDVLRYKPDIVYVQYGANDANRWQTDQGVPRLYPDEFRECLLSIVRRCKHFGSLVILGNNHTGAYNGYIKNISHYATWYVNHAAYAGEYLMPDGIHLNECGHQLYFENIVQAIP